MLPSSLWAFVGIAPFSKLIPLPPTQSCQVLAVVEYETLSADLQRGVCVLRTDYGVGSRTHLGRGGGRSGGLVQDAAILSILLN